MDSRPFKPADGRQEQPPGDPQKADAEELARLSRRRALLRGLGKGFALMGAALPIKSMAYTAALTGDGKLCTISGVQSGAHSSTTITAECGGYNTFYYADKKNWPKKFSNGTNQELNETNAFSVVFKSSSSFQSKVIDIVTDTVDSDEKHWIVALLNANATKSGFSRTIPVRQRSLRSI